MLGPARTLGCSLAGLALALTPGAHAQTLTRTGGVLGTQVGYEIAGGTPGSLYLFVPSVTEGPIDLALFDPGETRQLDVGFELLDFWGIGVFDGTGGGAVTFPLPLNPNLHGVPFFAQFVELPVVPTLFGGISNRTGVTLALEGESATTIGANVDAIYGHTATELEDGRVLIAGGYVDVGAFAVIQDGLVVFDPQTEEFEELPQPLLDGRVAHTATRLADGRVLFLGGADPTNAIVATGEIWDPSTGTVTPTAPMVSPRTQHTATLLADGRVYVAGGLASFDFTDIVAALNQALDSAEVYDPTTNTWAPAPSLPKPRAAHGATRLGNGDVLIAGGMEVNDLFGLPVPTISADCRRYTPGSNSMVSAASMPNQRALFGLTPLPNGDAVVVGGADGVLLTLEFFPLAQTAIYDASVDAWTPGANLGTARGYATAHVIGDELHVIGGVDSVDLLTISGTPTTSIEVADLGLLSWTAAGALVLPRELAVSVPIEGGARVLTTGAGDNGSGGAIPDLSAELYHP